MNLPPLPLLLLQLAMSFTVWGLLARRVASPWLAARPREQSAAALLWVHAFRFVPLALLAPGQTQAPGPVLAGIALGDFLASLVAVAALLALYARGVAAMGAVRLFSAVSTIDIVVALGAALASGVYRHPLGTGWFVLTLYVPLVIVTQAMLFGLLRPRGPDLDGSQCCKAFPACGHRGDAGAQRDGPRREGASRRTDAATVGGDGMRANRIRRRRSRARAWWTASPWAPPSRTWISGTSSG